MADSKKTGMTPGQMKNLVGITTDSVPADIGKRFAHVLGQRNLLANHLKKFWENMAKYDVFPDEIPTFRVGDAFGKTNVTLVGEKTKELFIGNSERTISAEIYGTLSKIGIKSEKTDAEVMHEADTYFLSQDEMFIIFYLLLVNYELGKRVFNGIEIFVSEKYLFHAIIGSGENVSASLFFKGVKAFIEIKDCYRDNQGNDVVWVPGTQLLRFDPMEI